MAAQVSTNHLSLPTGESVFYRQAGESNKNTILLLHGFPSSSHQFRNLIPLLASKHRVIAPDLPGYGFTTVPAGYTYTFDNLAETIKSFVKTIANPPAKYVIYIFDYGSPTGLRLALSDPHAVSGIISQNGNAYEEGFTSFWDTLKKYWISGAQEDRDALRSLFTADTTKFQYTAGTPQAKLASIAPESYTLDQVGLDRPGNAEIQLDLFYDYRKNVDLYPKFHEYFRETQVPLLAVWGKNDPIFGPAGAEAFKKDLPNAEVHLLDAGHFLLETNLEEIAKLMVDFLDRHQI
ncbi:hydrolase alpha/beta fold family [Dacryopinax primogenitus]|uniref:Hydrolase alpha/beta fold family n=1 Tax=Dacryopinax primogenitus (strain DJM 731) TaxID=1858805 RepID=M5G8L9_DACPD|nr:hydrolase alpha/beta fold family [Dacryopinax primogenitus]EJU05094.1 hydrolase alpha/beta fold family [Dacryopinax primogenitus]